MLKLRHRRQLPSHAPTMLASTVTAQKPVPVVSAFDSDFEPFVADAFVSLVGSDNKVPIKLLRDTGANHSFIVESALRVRNGGFGYHAGYGIGHGISTSPLHKA